MSITRPIRAIFLVLTVTLASPGSMSAAAQQLPNEFSIQSLASFNLPSALAFLPDGRTIVTELRTARVFVFSGGSVGTLGTIPNVDSSRNERGLLSVVADAAWPARPYLYFYYSHLGANENRIVRYAITGALTNPASTNLTLGAAYRVIGLSGINDFHNGGKLRFGSDGMLYASNGDDGDACSAQDRDTLSGAVYRMNVAALPASGRGPPSKSSLIPAGNPFTTGSDEQRLTWCYGLRNPFSFNIDPATGHLYIADVGKDRQEELNESTGGENFGWPWKEGTVANGTCPGSSTPPASVDPIGGYAHTAGPKSIVSMTRYRNVLGGAYNFGNAYEGNVFFHEFYDGFIRRLAFSNGWTAGPPVPGQPNATDWATGISNVADAVLGPDGAIYFTDLGTQSLSRIIRTPALPAITSPSTARVGQTYVVASARSSGDVVIVAVALATTPPLPIPNAFGRLEIVPEFLFAGPTDAAGIYRSPPIPVPAVALGATLYFQTVHTARGENYLSPVQRVTVIR